MRIKRELKNNITYLSLVEEVYNPEKKRGEIRKIKDYVSFLNQKCKTV